MRKYRYASAAIVGIIGLTLSSCSSSGSNSRGTTTASGGSGGGLSGTINVGVDQPLSGVAAAFADAELNGAKYAVQNANDQHLLGGNVKLKLDVKDDEFSNSQAVINAQSILKSNDVAMFGPLGIANGTTALVGKKMLNVVTEATPPLDDSDPYVYNLTSDYAGSFTPVGAYLKTKGVRSLAFVWDPANPKHQGLMSGAQTVFQTDGISVAKKISVDPKQTQFIAPMHTLASENPDAIYILADAQAATMIRELRGDGYKGQIICFFGPPAIVAPAGSLAAGVAQPAFFSPLKAVNRQATTFITGFEKVNKAEPDSYAAEGYDAMMFIVAAIKSADSSDRSAIATAAGKLAGAGLTGVQGNYTFSKRQATLPSIVLIYGSNGKPASVFAG